MPRTKTFSIDSALDKAMKLFWERGYEATTILEIAEGLSRSSIYATLGHKKALFEQVLRRYGSEFRVPGLSELRAAVSPRAALVEVFRQTIASGVGKQRRDSCLLINTALELKSNSDPEIARMIEDAVLDMEMRFREAIDRSRGAGETIASVNPVQTARVLLGLYLGLYMLARFDAVRDPVVDAVVRQVEALLPPPSADGARG